MFLFGVDIDSSEKIFSVEECLELSSIAKCLTPTPQNGQTHSNCFSVFDHLVMLVLKGLNESFQNSYLLQCANMYINRCLAVSVFLPALFHLKEEETELKNKLWKEMEKLFVSSMDVPGELSDGELNVRVHLSLFYYFSNHRGESMKMLVEILPAS